MCGPSRCEALVNMVPIFLPAITEDMALGLHPSVITVVTPFPSASVQADTCKCIRILIQRCVKAGKKKQYYPSLLKMYICSVVFVPPSLSSKYSVECVYRFKNECMI